MARTAFFAPAHRVRGRSAPGSLAPGNFPNSAPSLDYGGSGLMDPRLPWNVANSPTGAQVIGWLGVDTICVTDQVPSAISTSNIAAAAHAVNGTPMTLVSATGSGITVVAAGGFLALPSRNTIPAGALAIDGEPNYIRLGISDYTGFYDPTTGISRAVSITGSSGASGGNFLISGADWYGLPMTQLLTVGAGAVTANTLKGFKFVESVVPQFADAHNYSVGTADIYSFDLAADNFAHVEIFWAGVLQTLSTFTAAVKTTATDLTGDTRGTFTPASSSDGTKQLQIFVTPSAARLTTVPMDVGLFGVAQA